MAGLMKTWSWTIAGWLSLMAPATANAEFLATCREELGSLDQRGAENVRTIFSAWGHSHPQFTEGRSAESDGLHFNRAEMCGGYREWAHHADSFCGKTAFHHEFAGCHHQSVICHHQTVICGIHCARLCHPADCSHVCNWRPCSRWWGPCSA